MPQPLLHRERDLAHLAAALDGARDGRPSVVLIRGVRGIGKTALMRAGLNKRPMDAMVLRAQCSAAESSFDLAVVHQLFDPVLEHTSGPDRLTPGTFAADVFRAAAGVHGGADAGTHDLMRALFQVTRSLAAARPVIVAVDDLGCADALSVLWFSFLARRIEGLPVVMLATVDSECSGELEANLADLPYLSVLHPEPLCPTCAADYVAWHLDVPLDHGLAAMCHTLSLGNPQVLTELAARLSAARIAPGAPEPAAVARIGAATLSATTLNWLLARNPVAMELLANLAVLDGGTDLATAAAITGHGEFEVEQARDALRRMGLLAATGPDRIRNELIRSAVLSGLDSARRIAIHERAAELLTRLGAPARVVAQHLMSLGSARDPRALRLLSEAAQDAVAFGDWDLAARYLRRAISEACDPQLTRELVGQLGRVEQHRDVAAFGRLAETAGTMAEGPALRALTLQQFLSPVLVADSSALARTLTDTARALAAADAAPRAQLLGLSAYSMLSGHRPPFRPAFRALVRTGAAADRRNDVDFLGALAALVATDGRHPRTAHRYARRSLAALGRSTPDIRALAAALALSWTGDVATAVGLVDRILDGVREQGHAGDKALALIARSDMEYRRGDWLRALTDAHEAAEGAESVNAAGLLAAAQACAARALVRLGEPAEAGKFVPAVARPALHPVIRGLILQARGMVAAGHDDHVEALRLFLECGHLLSSHGIGNQRCVPWRAHAAEEYRAQGQPLAARTIALPDPVAGSRPWAAAGAAGAARMAEAVPGPRVRLTAAERRVTELVLRGLSNAEVAERLFLSKRTVDTHLGRIYRKLAISGRPELAAAVEDGA